MMRQSQIDTLITPVISHFFDVGMSRVPVMRNELFTVLNSTLAYEKGVGLGGFSVDAWNQYANSGHKGQLSFDQLYSHTYTPLEYVAQLMIEKRLLQNDQYGVVQQAARKAGMSGNIKMEVDAAGLLNNAFATVTFGDGKTLCATDHPRSPHDATTQSNSGTTALSAAAVESTRLLMRAFTDDKNNLIGVNPDELWVPPALEKTAWEIVNSINIPDSANNNANFYNGKMRVKVWDRLTDSNNWFMADSLWRAECAKWYNRQAPEIMLVDESTTHLTYELKLYYSFGVDDWRWIYGHAVA